MKHLLASSMAPGARALNRRSAQAAPVSSGRAWLRLSQVAALKLSFAVAHGWTASVKACVTPALAHRRSRYPSASGQVLRKP